MKFKYCKHNALWAINLFFNFIFFSLFFFFFFLPGRENSTKTEEDQTPSVLRSSRKTVIRLLFLLT